MQSQTLQSKLHIIMPFLLPEGFQSTSFTNLIIIIITPAIFHTILITPRIINRAATRAATSRPPQ